NLVNQTTAKATLTQMLNVIFSRMESFSSKNIKLNNNEASSNCDTLNDPKADHKSASLSSRSASNELMATYLTIRKDIDSVEHVVADLVETVCSCSENGELTVAIDQECIANWKQPHPPVSRTPSLSNSSAIISSDSFESNDTIHLVFDNIYQKDAYLVFRS